ncbi:MAG: tetratricopeptide repeat protein [Magnetococcales bacterium]|nr:tetratricopeptide repeat protein [Magnetococcales bacterium]
MRMRALRALGLMLLLGTGGCVTAPDPATRGASPMATPVVSTSRSTEDLPESDRLAMETVRLIADNRLGEASKTINVALKQRIDRSYYHLLNGFVYHLIARGKERDESERGSYDLAKQGYEMAIKFDGGNWLAHYLFGRLCIELGDFAGAQKHLAEAMSLRKDDPEVLSSLIYAAYRNNAPEVAAGAVNAMDAQGSLRKSDTALRNASMVMSALGENGRAEGYLEQLRGVTNNNALLDHLERRVKEWREFYTTESGLRSADVGFTTVAAGGLGGLSLGALSSIGSPGGMGSSNPFGGSAPLGGVGGVTDPNAQKTAPGTEGKMVVVDVVMILTEENLQSSRGVNLLGGLQLQFGDGTNPAFQSKWGKSFTDAAGHTETRAITRALTIPAISYTLNIMNANSQRNEILARPTLVALAGESSEFFSGVDLTAAAVSMGSQGGDSVRVQKEIGVRLFITPTFIDADRLKLAVIAERSFLNTPSNDVVFSYKLVTTLNKVTASVVMRYGETLILGGLSEKEGERSNDGVPGLREVPGLQYLFSRDTKTDYQKSVLVLLTPHPPQYVYQSERAREVYEKSLNEDERPLANLRARYADWFKPYPNWASVFHHLQENSLYREFRTGDVDLESWASQHRLRDRLNQIQDFLYY